MIKSSLIPYFFVFLALVILGPMLLPGYILTLDMSWGPQLPFVWNHDTFNNAFLVTTLLHVLSLVIPSWIVQKILLITIFFLLFYIPWRFLPYITHPMAQVCAAMLYALNPFVYARTLAGQWMVLLSYALLPLLLYTLVRLIRKPDKRAALMFAGSLFLISLSAIHFVYLSLLCSLFFMSMYAGLYVGKKAYAAAWQLVTRVGLGVALFLLVSMYWIVPAMTRHAPLESKFDERHFTAFAPAQHEGVPVMLNVAALGGFWAERNAWKYYFVWPQESPLFWITACILALIALYGAYRSISDPDTRFFSLVMVCVGIIAYITALGVSESPFYSWNLWLYQHMPRWNGLRDSQKIAGFLSLVYALFAGMGLSHIFSKYEKHTVYSLIIAVAVVLPVIFGMYEWGGFQRQLRPVQYPSAWYQAKTILDQAPLQEKVLVFPWHGYFSLPFAEQLIVANPASAFFGQERVISAKNAEVGDVYDQETGGAYGELDTLIRNASQYPEKILLEKLQEHSIDYILIIDNPARSEGDAWFIPQDSEHEQIENYHTFMNLPATTLLQGEIVLKKLQRK